MRPIVLALILLFPLTGFSQNWASVGGGYSNSVASFYADSSFLYLGHYPYLPGQYAFVRWNGSVYDTLNTPCNTTITAITNYQDKLIIAGRCGVMSWDGSDWEILGTVGSNEQIVGLNTFEDDLIAVGYFDSINGVPASKVARWDGTNWSAIDTTKWFDEVKCAIEYQGDLYIGGRMFTSGVNRLARWDGTRWEQLDDILLHIYPEYVNCFQIYQDDLYIGGSFWIIDVNPGNHIMRWDGTNWKDIGTGVYGIDNFNGEVRDITIANNQLYAVGRFVNAGGVPARYVAKWDGYQWCGFGDTINGNVFAIAQFQEELYIGGNFDYISGDTIRGFAKWIGGDYVDTCGSLTSINENDWSDIDFELYPNPATTSLTLQSNNTRTTTYVIHDITGRQIQQGNFVSKKEINIQTWAKGVYVVQCQNEEGVFRGKWVKE